MNNLTLWLLVKLISSWVDRLLTIAHDAEPNTAQELRAVAKDIEDAVRKLRYVD